MEENSSGGAATGNAGLVKRLFRRRSSTRVFPGEDASNEPEDQSLPSSPKDVNKNSILLFTGTLIPNAFVDSQVTEEGFLTPMQLYNSMNDGQLSPYLYDPSFMLIIDTRSPDDYKQMHVSTAVHVTELANVSEAFESYTLIILYDHKGLSFSIEESILRKTFNKLQEQNSELFVLKGGFDEFYRKHPYLCTSKVIMHQWERHLHIKNYPSIVLDDQLYLGRGDQANNINVIHDLQITHIVNVCREHSNAFPDTVQYLLIAVDDENSANLLREFSGVITFLTEAFQNKCSRVLVHCNLGRSRSSTLVLAYIMFKNKWILKDAFNFVKERRPIIQPNRGFLVQLLKFEEILFGQTLTNVEEIYDNC